ncbi:hypothetical protein N7494_011767 [Penicillium frequentans]|uniref:Uncharacterized protein n=1 Tax=Penicillium frequentans TaxID=3151616 RepID=A0AAD6CKA3_9EURO|nr:hypothetical protein N7494_011767 [Penicillium glabrum]
MRNVRIFQLFVDCNYWKAPLRGWWLGNDGPSHCHNQRHGATKGSYSATFIRFHRHDNWGFRRCSIGWCFDPVDRLEMGVHLASPIEPRLSSDDFLATQNSKNCTKVRE